MATVVADVAAAVTAIGTAVSAFAANAALALGAGSALTDAISAAAFTIATSGIALGALYGVSQLLKVGGGGMQVDFKADPQAGVPYVIGRTGTGGNIVFTDVAGSNNQDLTYVTVLGAGGPYHQVESFSAGGYVLTFNGAAAWSATTGEVAGFAPVQSDGSPAPLPSFSGKMWMKAQLGAQPEASALSISGPTMPSEWGASQKLSGCCAAMWCLRYDTNTYPAGTPRPLWVVQGAPAYDPRQDSTYPGGSGAQRAATPSTWAYSENPYCHALTWLLGIKANAIRILGVGAALASIDVASFVTGANVADANGWKVGGVVYSTDNKWDVLAAMLQAGGGVPIKLGASISCFVNTPVVSLDNLTAADVVGPVSIQATQARKNRINAIWPQYREESCGWQLTPTQQAVGVSSYITADGEPRSRQVSYLLVQDANQASQLARYDIENSREFGPCTFPCKPRWMGYKPGDCITVDEPEYGLNNQTMVITGREVDPQTMVVTLICRSETAAKHPFALGQTGTAPSTPGITGIDVNMVYPPLTAWSMTGSEFVGAGSGTQPALIIDGAADVVGITGIIVDWREQLTTAPTWGPWASLEFPPSATRLVIPGVKNATVYGAQVRYRTAKGVEDFSAAQSLGTTTTGTIAIPNQGLLAQLNSIEDAQLKAGVGQNALVDTTFTLGFDYWRSGGDNSLTATVQTSGTGSAQVSYLRNVMSGSAGQQLFIASDNQVDSLPVTAGQYLELSAAVAASGVSSADIEVRFHDATGAAITSISSGGSYGFLPPLASSSSLGTLTNDPSTWPRITGFCQVPSGASRASLWVRGICAGGTATLAVFEPMMAKARSGTADPTPYNPGFRGDPAATAGATAGTDLKSSTGTVLGDSDVITAVGVASAVTGQQNGATTKFSKGATAPTSPAIGDQWVDTTSSTVYLIKRWNGSSWDIIATVGAVSGVSLYSLTAGLLGDADVITDQGIASAVTGQKNGATTKFSRQSTAPSSPASGDQWVDTSTTPNQIKQWDASSSVWAVIGTVGAVLGSNVYSTTHGVQGDADLITNQGTASAISGQAATATSSDFSAITGTTKPSNNATVGAVLGSNLSSTTHGVQGDSDVITNLGVASAIAGQAAAATDSSIQSGATFNGLYISTSDPAPVGNGAIWLNPNTGVTKMRVSGAWTAFSGLISDGTVMLSSYTGGASGTFTIPSTAQPKCTVTVQGGAGGDGFEASSIGLGGGGGTCTLKFSVTPGSTTITWALGSAGAGNAFASGANGTSSTVTSTAFSGTMTGGGEGGAGDQNRIGARVRADVGRERCWHGMCPS